MAFWDTPLRLPCRACGALYRLCSAAQYRLFVATSALRLVNNCWTVIAAACCIRYHNCCWLNFNSRLPHRQLQLLLLLLLPHCLCRLRHWLRLRLRVRLRHRQSLSLSLELSLRLRLHLHLCLRLRLVSVCARLSRRQNQRGRERERRQQENPFDLQSCHVNVAIVCVYECVFLSTCVCVCNCVAHLVGFLRLQLQLLCRLAKRTRIASPAAAAFVIFIVPSLPGISLSRSPSLSTLRSLSYIPLYRWVSLTVCLTLENGFVCGSLVLKLRASLCAAPCCLLSLSLPYPHSCSFCTPCIPLYLSQRHSTLINATFACCSCLCCYCCCPAAGPASAPCPLSMSTCTFISVCSHSPLSLSLAFSLSPSSFAFQLCICLLA